MKIRLSVKTGIAEVARLFRGILSYLVLLLPASFNHHEYVAEF